MYEWLENEIAEIQYRRFHLTNENVQCEGVDIPEEWYNALPPSYLTFQEQFGGARLYRSRAYYRITLYAVPKLVFAKKDGEELVLVGFSDAYGYAYFRLFDVVPGVEVAVFEMDPDDAEPVLEQGAENFAHWLQKRCEQARESFFENKWQEILTGSPAFTEEELQIIAARTLFEWEIIGVTDNGDFRFRVRNGSDMILPYLSLGVVAKNGLGGIWLPVSGIKPGQTEIVEQGVYKSLWQPQDIEIHALPDPEPEDREQYWEFKKLNK